MANPNVVKAVLGAKKQKISPALYFSRAEIPFCRPTLSPEQKINQFNYFRHIGIYAFGVATLRQLVDLTLSELEQVEMLEQLSWLYNGFSVGAIATEFSHLSIDTAEDLAAAQAQFNF